MERGFQRIDSALYVTDGFARFSELLNMNSNAISESFYSLIGTIA